ncbi:MAG: hypothetical protein AN485_22425 [Anabaena sp. MDT14b]|nr:MAG: hypothetical protein AN485_22425 [Anabaena sp. MDT14b]
MVRAFIPRLASIASPLDALRLVKRIDLGDPSVWSPACEEAFLSIKEAIAAAPVLSKPAWGEPFFVATDASSVGLGAVLFQGSREDPRYVVCVSRALSASERNYSATKRELLGIIFALRKLRFYLAGRRFHVFTDHKALTFMLEQKRLSDMLERWLDEILEFDFTISHIPGILNVLPDCLSRLYAAPERSFLGTAPLIGVLSLPPLPESSLDAYGLPHTVWGDFFEGGVTVRRMPDWLPAVPIPLGGGGGVVLDPFFEWDPDFHTGFPLGPVPPSPDHPMIAAVARAAAAGGRTALGAAREVPGEGGLDGLPMRKMGVLLKKVP